MINEKCPRCNGWIWRRAEPCNCRSLASKPTVGFLDALGERIRSERLRMAMSLDELANRSGMSKTGLWQIEKGKSEPGAQTIVAIARALDLTSDYLLGVNQ